MSIHIPQNFYRQTITRAVTLTGATNIYVSAHPTPDEGYITISPASATLREIIYYTAKGTDGNGTYITITLANRGLGGTTAQTHVIGEPVRMNVGAETIQEISDALDQVVAASAQDSSTTVKGITKLSVAPVSASNPIAVGDNDPRLSIASDIQNFESTGTWTKPAGTPRYVQVICIGGGGGGANGNGITNGGGGGGGGGKIIASFPASLLGSTETVTVGTGGAATVNGNSTTFGAWIKAFGGIAGGATTGGAGGQGVSAGSAATLAATNGGAGGGNSGSGTGGIGYLFGAAGGAGGGDGAAAGGVGGAQNSRATPIVGGTAGAGAGGAGGNATNCTQYEPTCGAGGGGGGGNGTSGNGGNGGNGGKYGGGGGGGGRFFSSGSPGVGGTGGNGFCQVITYF